MTTLVFGKVTRRHFNRMDSVLYINDNIALSTPSGSLIDRTVSRGDYGYFSFDSDFKITDFCNPNKSDEYTEKAYAIKTQALKVATQSMINSYRDLSLNDRAIVTNALATAVSGSVCIASVIGTVVSICTGDVTGMVGGAAASAVTGVIAYMSYENMTAAMQRAYDCSEAFNKALTAYHQFAETYAPEHMRQLPIYNPEFQWCTKLVRTVFPHITEEQFMCNQLNWSVA